jgi:hypothetical protein
MQNSHLVIILRTFSKKEVRDLRKWLNSIIHNQREDVIQLFEYLMVGDHLEKEKFLEKERVFPKIYPDTPYDDARMRQCIHFLLKAVEEFLIYQELRGDEIRSRMALSSVYRKRRLAKAFQKTIKSVETLQEKAPYRDEHFLRNEYLLELEKYYFFEGKKRTTEINLQQVSDALDVTFLADKLRQTCMMFAHQAVYKTRYNIGLLEETISYVDENDLLHHPAISLYYYGYKMYTDKTDSRQHYFNLRNTMEANMNLFTRTEIRDIYLMATNYCTNQINRGQGEMRKELFQLYRIGVENQILMESGELSRFTFRNIVNLGTALKELDWINKFTEEYQHYLNEQHREKFIRFAKAKLHYARGEYDAAMPIIATLDFDDVLTNLYSKGILIIMYYEQDEIDALESLLDSMRTYLRRKQVMGNYKVIYSNLITYTRKLIKVNVYDKEQVSKLKKEIMQVGPLPEKQWFLKQIERM